MSSRDDPPPPAAARRPGPPPDGFSVASLVAFAARALAETDPALLPGGFSIAALREPGARVGSEKRRLADHAFAVGGAAPLLGVGRRLRDVALHPGIAVLLDPPDPAVLRERWTRRERYHRSPHRVEIEPAGGRGWDCTHRSSSRAPSAGESVLVAGTLAGLLELIGAEGVALRFGEAGAGREALVAGVPTGTAIDPAGAHRFALRWTGVEPANAIDVGAAAGAGRPGATGLASAAGAGPGSAAARVLALLGADVARRWTLAEAARALSTSTRSLQRALGADGRSFSALVREARVAEAAWRLRATDDPLELVGFRAGFADQPHFQREFARALDVTPADYRRVARAGPAGGPDGSTPDAGPAPG